MLEQQKQTMKRMQNMSPSELEKMQKGEMPNTLMQPTNKKQKKGKGKGRGGFRF